MATKPAPGRTFSTSVSIPPATRTRMHALLDQQLADAFDLWSQVKQAHWNVKGTDFWQLHKLFDEVAARAAEWVDLLAERITATGGYAHGTVRMAAAASTLPEFPTGITDGREHVRAAAERLAALANSTRDAIDAADKAGDANTADLFTEISRCADTYLYYLEAHVQE